MLQIPVGCQYRLSALTGGNDNLLFRDIGNISGSKKTGLCCFIATTYGNFTTSIKRNESFSHLRTRLKPDFDKNPGYRKINGLTRLHILYIKPLYKVVALYTRNAVANIFRNIIRFIQLFNKNGITGERIRRNNIYMRGDVDHIQRRFQCRIPAADYGNPLSGIQIYASGTNYHLYADTGADGSYSLNAAGGHWGINVNCNNGGDSLASRLTDRAAMGWLNRLTGGLMIGAGGLLALVRP